MAKSPVKVVQDATDPVPTEILAKAIRDIAVGVRALRKGPNTLTDRALFLLIQDAAPTKIGMREIASVFTAIDALEKSYLRPAVKS